MLMVCVMYVEMEIKIEIRRSRRNKIEIERCIERVVFVQDYNNDDERVREQRRTGKIGYDTITNVCHASWMI